MAGIIIAIVAIITVAWLIIAKAHAASAIFVVGTILLLIAGLMGKVSASTVEIKSSGTALYDELLIIEHIIAGRFSGIGLSIMVLFGFVAYMRHIGADARSVVMLSAPLKRFHGSYWLVPITFVLGSVLSLVVPSAAGLSLLLIATLLPALIAAGLSPLTVGAVIVTSSTIMPTPLEAGIIQGAKLTDMTPSSFVFGHVAKATVPTLILTSLVHMWWQWYMDRRDVRAGRGHDPHVTADDQADRATAEAMERASTVPAAYALLPILPLLVIIVTAILNQSGAIGFEFGIVPTTVVCSLFALICEMIRTRSVTSVFDGFKSFFTGMGDAPGGRHPAAGHHHRPDRRCTVLPRGRRRGVIELRRRHRVAVGAHRFRYRPVLLLRRGRRSPARQQRGSPGAHPDGDLGHLEPHASGLTGVCCRPHRGRRDQGEPGGAREAHRSAHDHRHDMQRYPGDAVHPGVIVIWLRSHPRE